MEFQACNVSQVSRNINCRLGCVTLHLVLWLMAAAVLGSVSKSVCYLDTWENSLDLGWKIVKSFKIYYL